MGYIPHSPTAARRVLVSIVVSLAACGSTTTVTLPTDENRARGPEEIQALMDQARESALECRKIIDKPLRCIP